MLQRLPAMRQTGEVIPSINIDADATYGALRITAQGETAKIIRWGALVETLEITN